MSGHTKKSNNPDCKMISPNRTSIYITIRAVKKIRKSDYMEEMNVII